MALIGNYSILNRQTTIAFSGGATARVPGLIRPHNLSYARHRTDAMPQNSGIPHTYTPPVSIVLPIKPGALASRFQSASGSISANANLGLQIAATPSASGDISNALMQIIVGISAALSAQGLITTAQMSILSDMVANLSAGGSITTAELSIIIGMTANLTASGSISPNLTTLLGMFADISSVTELSPEGLAASLLDNNDIETGYSMRESLRLILSALAGKVSGAGTSTITIRDINDTNNRIVATVDSNGNRTDVTKDVT